MNDFYEQHDIFLIHDVYDADEWITLVTFNDGKQWCSHCGVDSVDEFTSKEMASFRLWFSKRNND